MCSKKKRFQDKTTKPTKDKQTNNRPTILFETEYFPFKKEKEPNNIRTQAVGCPRHIRYLHINLAGKAWNFELIENQDTNDSVNPKSQCSGLKTLANREPN